MRFILYLIFISTLIFAQKGSQLSNPNSNVYDFTFEDSNAANIRTFRGESIVEKALVEVEKAMTLTKRTPNLFACGFDIYNNRYCPSSLTEAAEYWGYEQSEVVTRTQTVVDFEQGTHQELTSTVRDFMDGFASTHNSTVTDYQTGSGTSNVGTVIDYQNGSSVSGIGQVVDYANKVTTSVDCSYTASSAGFQSMALRMPYAPNGGWYNHGNTITIANVSEYGEMYYFSLKYENGQLYSTFTGTWKNAETNMDGVGWFGIRDPNHTNTTYHGYISFRIYNDVLQGRYCYIQNAGACYVWGAWYDINSNTPIETFAIVDNATTIYDYKYYISFSTGSCANGGTLSGSTCLKTCTTTQCPNGYTATTGTETAKGQCKRTVSYNFYQYTCPSTYSPINSGFTSYTKTDPNTSAENWNSLDDAVNSATAPTGNCQKTITYSYYKYNCPTGYTVRDGGLTSACPRTDPNNTINNESTLSQPCNNSTPPTGNCEKIIPYTFYSYECSSGYTAIDKGLATCTKTDSSTSTNTSSTLSQPCNSATPPKENCYKDISYKHYTYGCSPGYITDNYGLSTCPKTDPNKSVNNSATLDDDCNSATPPPGNCQRPIEYSLYEYICNGTNEFGEAYRPIDSGLTTCNRNDTDNIAVNGGTLDDACNSSTAPVNNCRAMRYTCNSTVIQPALVDGMWQCSPYICDEQNKCGFGTCPTGTTPSTTYFQDVAYNPLGADFNGTCTGAICDYVANQQISFCQSGRCPNGSEYEVISGKCYKKECPVGTFDSNGSCIKQN